LTFINWPTAVDTDGAADEGGEDEDGEDEDVDGDGEDDDEGGMASPISV
jgi:hypothetical protein